MKLSTLSLFALAILLAIGLSLAIHAGQRTDKSRKLAGGIEVRP